MESNIKKREEILKSAEQIVPQKYHEHIEMRKQGLLYSSFPFAESFIHGSAIVHQIPITVKEEDERERLFLEQTIQGSKELLIAFRDLVDFFANSNLKNVSLEILASKLDKFAQIWMVNDELFVQSLQKQLEMVPQILELEELKEKIRFLQNLEKEKK